MMYLLCAYLPPLYLISQKIITSRHESDGSQSLFLIFKPWPHLSNIQPRKHHYTIPGHFSKNPLRLWWGKMKWGYQPAKALVPSTISPLDLCYNDWLCQRKHHNMRSIYTQVKRSQIVFYQTFNLVLLGLQSCSESTIRAHDL
uniref:Uncharacterized protein n=1 Tax=Cacopsylla melanoneura TaxID=428564 RepID=A0A8D8Y0Z7_9HEMI